MYTIYKVQNKLVISKPTLLAEVIDCSVSSKMAISYGQCCRVLMVAVVLSMSAANAQTDDNVANEGNPCSIGWFRAHGWLMWLTFGVFLPLGVLVARFGKYYFPQWFWTHISLQVTGVILSTIAFAIAASKFPVSTWDSTHVKLGMAIMVLVWLQALAALIRPHRGTKPRVAWFSVHWLIGTTAIILAWFNIFKGLDVYVGSWPSGGERKASYVLWGVNVAILAFVYLLLDRLPYIRAQSKDPDYVVGNVGSDEANGYTHKTVNGRAPV